MLNKLKAVWATIWTDLVDTYKRVKIYVLGLLAIIAFFEWNKLKAAILARLANKEMKSDQTQDKVISQLANQDNIEADALVKQAQGLPAQEKPVQSDWYEKDSK